MQYNFINIQTESHIFSLVGKPHTFAMYIKSLLSYTTNMATFFVWEQQGLTREFKTEQGSEPYPTKQRAELGSCSQNFSVT